MDQFKGKTAVITGAGSGIGRAIAKRCAQEGMNLALADIDKAALDETANQLQTQYGDALEIQIFVCDVSKPTEVAALEEMAFGRFGAVHLLFNNAGVGTGGLVWQNSISDWNWVLGVNLFGVIHGVKYFTEKMHAQNEECWIVNTASMAGLITAPGMGIYNVSKHAVVALTETLHHDLALVSSKVKAAVLCPAYVQTRILESETHRQPEHSLEPKVAISPEHLDVRKQAIENGIQPEAVADCVFEGIRENRFYLITHPEWLPLAQARISDILGGNSPVSPMQRAVHLATAAAGQDQKSELKDTQ